MARVMDTTLLCAIRRRSCRDDKGEFVYDVVIFDRDADDYTLSDYNIQKESTLLAHYKMNGSRAFLIM